MPHPTPANPLRPHSQQQDPATDAAQTSFSRQASGNEMVSIMVQPYPEVQQLWLNLEAEDQMQIEDSIVRAVRKLRNDYGLQRQRPELFIQVHLFWECSLPVQSTAHHVCNHTRLCLHAGPIS